MENFILAHYKAKERFLENGIETVLSSYEPIRLYNMSFNGKLIKQYPCWRAQTPTGARVYLRIDGGEVVDRWGRFKNYREATLALGEGFRGNRFTICYKVANEYVKSFDESTPTKTAYRIIT